MRKISLTVFAYVVSASVSYAASSTDLVLNTTQARVYQSRVNTEDCTDPINSGSYIIVAGNGGTNMDISCPPHHPVMYNWQQQLGFGGIGMVSWGGGSARIRCCALIHEWNPAPLSPA